MGNVRIFTDSCSDLDKKYRDEYGIDYVQMNIVWDGKELPASLDWEQYSAHDMYDHIRKGNRITTTQVPAESFLKAFSEAAEAGDDVVYIACAAVLSGSVNTGAVVAGKVMDEHPDVKIYCIDSFTSCHGEGLLAIEAAKLRNDGKTAAEIATAIEEKRNYTTYFCTVKSLDALKRAGRVSASSAFFGNLFGVKPVIYSAANGQNVALKKVKGRDASIQEVVNLMKTNIVDAENQVLFVGHSDDEADAKILADKIRAEIPCKDIVIGSIGPIIGASVGVDAVVVSGFTKKVDSIEQA